MKKAISFTVTSKRKLFRSHFLKICKTCTWKLQNIAERNFKNLSKRKVISC